MVARGKTIYQTMLSGVLWSVLLRWSVKLIGLISMVILARLLTPEDFGVVAMASLVIGLLYSLSELGMQTYLIRESNVSREHCDTAWTIKVIQHAVIGILLILLAPFAAKYFDDNRVVPVIYLLAFGALIAGFENIGIIFFRKNLDFDKDYRFEVLKRIMLFFVTVTLAIGLRNYWALAISQVVSTGLGVVISYSVHPYRPRFCLRKLPDFIAFATSILPMSIGDFMNNKVDVLIVGRIADTAQMGMYNVASELSSLFTKEIVYPVTRGLFPNFAKLKDDRQELAKAFLFSFSCVAAVCMPLGAGLWSVADDFVLLILGAKWEITIPFIKWLVIYATATSLIGIMTGRILIVSGFEQLAAILVWIRVFLISLLALGAGLIWGIHFIAPSLAFSSAIIFPLAIITLSKIIKVSTKDIILSFYRPLAAALTMSIVLDKLPFIMIDMLILRFSGKVILGVFIYSALIYLLWFLARKPNGVESAVFQFVGKRMRGGFQCG